MGNKSKILETINRHKCGNDVAVRMLFKIQQVRLELKFSSDFFRRLSTMLAPAAPGMADPRRPQPLAGADPDLAALQAVLVSKHGVDVLIPDWMGWRSRYATRSQPLAHTGEHRPGDKTLQKHGIHMRIATTAC